MIVNADLLSENGYERYSDTIASSNPGYVCTWQRRFLDGEVTAYFVDVIEYDYAKVPQLKIPFEKAYAAKCQFNTKNDETFNVEYFIRDNTTLADIHRFFEEMFYKMECKHYDD